LPHRFAGKLSPSSVNESLLRSLHRCEQRFADQLDAIGAHNRSLAKIGSAGRAESPAPRWDQSWFAPLDASVLYTIVCDNKPTRIVEIGGGHSTRFIIQAITDCELCTEVTVIDPDPAPALRKLSITLKSDVLKPADAILFEPFRPSDILSVDGSHLLMPGTDLDIVLNHILPALPVGALIHFHDIFWPDPYPAVWNWRGYNEQNAIAPLVLNGALEVLFASHFVTTRMTEAYAHLFVAGLPQAPDALNSSLWLRKV